MGKNNKLNKPSKNVFKVAGARSFKVKNKAKAVSSQLKKLNEVTKKKTAEVDKQLNNLQEEVRQQSCKKEEKIEEKSSLVSRESVKEFEQSEKKFEEAVDQLTDMSML